MSEFHPDLKLARFIPTPGGGERVARVVRRFKVPAARVPDDMLVENVTVPGRNAVPLSDFVSTGPARSLE